MSRNLVPLADSLSEASRLYSSKTAVMHGERHLTYSELNEEVERFARGLMSTGIGKGDPVIVWMPNSIEWNIVFPARDAEVPCYQPQGNPRRGPGMGPEFQDLVAGIFADSHYFPVFSLWIRFPGLERGSH